jgi:hypothetical protein
MKWNCSQKDAGNQFRKKRNSIGRPLKHPYGVRVFLREHWEGIHFSRWIDIHFNTFISVDLVHEHIASSNICNFSKWLLQNELAQQFFNTVNINKLNQPQNGCCNNIMIISNETEESISSCCNNWPKRTEKRTKVLLSTNTLLGTMLGLRRVTEYKPRH